MKCTNQKSGPNPKAPSRELWQDCFRIASADVIELKSNRGFVYVSQTVHSLTLS